MLLRMKSNLFRHSRMNGVLIPSIGETVELSEDDAAPLLQKINGFLHAEVVDPDADDEADEPAADADEASKHEPMTTADAAPAVDETAAVEAPENAEKRGRGRPRKAAE